MTATRQLCVCLAVLATLFFSATFSNATTIIVNPIHDNTLFTLTPTVLSNGSGEHLFTGRTRTGRLRRAVLWFDIDRWVPPGVTITNVTLRMTATQGFSTVVDTVDVHRLLTDWGEGISDSGTPGGQGAAAEIGDATWLHSYYPSVLWTNEGGDFGGLSAATVVDTPHVYTWTGPGLVADVQDMLDNPAGDYGWILKGQEHVFYQAKRWESRESLTPPELEITYSTTVEIAAEADNTLYFYQAGDSSNGLGEYMFAGANANFLPRRAVIKFDVASVIPPGAPVTSATLRLYMSRTNAALVTADVNLLRLTSKWGEGTSDALGEEGRGAASTAGDATWIHTFYPGVFWTSPGGDYTGLVTATATVKDTGFYDWTSAQLATDVEAMAEDPANNFGWILIGDENTSLSTKRFNTKDNNTGPWPVLIVEYGPPGLNPTTVEPVETPVATHLERPFPNPFNPSTTIAFSLDVGSQVRLDIYDVAGRRVRTLLDERRTATRHTVVWDGRNDAGEGMPSGVYFVRLEAPSLTETRKVLLLK